jgi:hypothetical protein
VQDVIGQSIVPASPLEKIIVAAAQLLSVYDVFEIWGGNLEPYATLVPVVMQQLGEAMGNPPTEEALKLVCRKMAEAVKKRLVVPRDLQTRTLSGFEPTTVTAAIIEKYASGFVDEFVLYVQRRDKSRFAERMRLLVTRMIGEACSELAEGLGNGFADVEFFLKHNIHLLLSLLGSEGVGLAVANVAETAILDFFVRSFKRFEQEERKAKPQAAPSPAPEEKKQTATPATPATPAPPPEEKKQPAPSLPTPPLAPVRVPEEKKQTVTASTAAPPQQPTPSGQTNPSARPSAQLQVE